MNGGKYGASGLLVAAAVAVPSLAADGLCRRLGWLAGKLCGCGNFVNSAPLRANVAPVQL